MKIGFIGLGKLGQPVAEVFSEHYYLEGYDIRSIENNYFKVTETLEEVAKEKDIIFIAVQTPHEKEYDGSQPIKDLPNKDFDYTVVENLLENLNPFVNKNQLVVLISTCLPGTVRNRLVPKIPNARFIYNPYLIAMGTVKADLIDPEMVIIGTEDGSESGDAKLLMDFYKPILKQGSRYEIGTWDEAESIKIFYNTFISAKLSLVNMIQDVAMKNGNINTDVVTSALARSDYRITGPAYMKAGLGDGGPCHPRDNIALRYLAEKLDLGYDLFEAIIHSREVQAENLAEFLMSFGLPVLIYGITYKSFVEYTDGSYSLLVKSFIDNKGYPCKVIDPNLKICEELNGPHAVLISYHDNNLKSLGFPKSSIIVDPWRQFPNNENLKVIYYGNTRTNVS